MILHGRNLIIQIDGVAVAASKSCTVTINADTLKTSSPQDGQWEHSIPARKSWKVQANSLFIEASASDTVIKSNISRVGSVIELSVTVDGYEADTVSGSAICKQFSATGSVGSLLQGSFQWEGTGPLE